MNADSLINGEYISYTLHPHQQPVGYATLNGTAAHLTTGNQQQYGVMHSDLLHQAASASLLATEAPEGPLMMSSGGVLLTLNGTPMHNGSATLHQSQGQTYTGGSPLGTVLVSTNNGPGTTVLGSPQPSSQSGQSSQRSSNNSVNSNSTNTSPTVHHHSSKKKRKCYSIDID